MLRFGFVATAFLVMTTTLAGLMAILRAARLPGRRAASLAYSRTLCRLLGVRVRVAGELVRDQPVLVIANHASWLDILVLTAIAPVVFVAKREIARWPLIGLVARARPTIFVDRERRHRTAEVNAQIAKRLGEGHPVVLFAEGTSSDGNRVLQFRSALLGSANAALAQGESVMLQPISIGYTRIQGLPIGRQHRPIVAWYGDIDFLPHLRQFVRRGAVDAVVTFGEPVAFDGADRKALVKSLESTVRRLTIAALRGRTLTSAA